MRKISFFFILLANLTISSFLEASVQDFYIKNDTEHKVFLVSCCGKNKIEISTEKGNIDDYKKGFRGSLFKVNKAIQKNYSPPKGMLYMTRFQYVDRNNNFKLQVISSKFKGSEVGGYHEEVVETYVVNVLDIKENSTFKVSSLYPDCVGYKVVFYNQEKRSL